MLRWIISNTMSKQDDKTIDVSWHPGRENIADYSFKHHSPTIYQNLQPTYLHIPNSPRYLQHSVTSHLLRGCAKTSPRSVLRTHIVPYRRMVPTPVRGFTEIWKKPSMFHSTLGGKIWLIILLSINLQLSIRIYDRNIIICRIHLYIFSAVSHYTFCEGVLKPPHVASYVHTF